MSSRLIALGFASVLLLTAGAPAFADDAVIMDSKQENVTTGNRNNSVNVGSQDAAIEGRNSNTGTSMRSNQVNDTVGNDSNAVNVGQQKYRRNSRP
ncbi:hypothetical protein [Chamaesiphon sp. GL140_3_metabinner_50]|uniref:hypothetical protein n=1 Tax=Chamaesiphon sp. GL140_3_metabinner_50 TaxID=2970812 RepID=UPI0025E98BC0|nr:hypothetical protein [Chamaesiphon sp. GL140_3_metabinner_50]